VDLVDVPQAARHGGHVDRGVAPAHHHHALAHVLQRPSLKAFRKAVAVTTLGASCAFNRQRRGRLRTQAQEHRVEIRHGFVSW
jgi:hypothetical protein